MTASKNPGVLETFSWQWTTLQKLIESKAFWGLNGLFVAVPIVARLLESFEVTLSPDVFLLYLAAWLLLFAAGLFHCFRPWLVGFSTFASFRDAGHSTKDLRREFEIFRGKLKAIEDLAVRTHLDNEDTAKEPKPEVFWYVTDFVDHKRMVARFTVTVMICTGALLMLIANGYRFSIVYGSTFGYWNSEESSMNSSKAKSGGLEQVMKLAMSVGEKVDVIHEDGKGGTKSTSGTLLNDDDNGYVIVETQGNRKVHIPRPRVVEISQ